MDQKRMFSSIDESLPAELRSADLRRLADVEERAMAQFVKLRRMDLSRVMEPMVGGVQKVLRIFVHSDFVGATANEPAHHLLTLEGTILDPALEGRYHFTDFFTSIAVECDSKLYAPHVYEWGALMAAQNTGVDVVQFKLYIASGTEPKANAGTCARIRLTRDTAVAFRYRVTDELRDVLPGLAVEPREEDVFQAFWAFLEINDLVDLRFRRLKKHDLLNPLFKVADASKVLIQHVKARLRDHLVAAEPIEVTHTLQHSSSCSIEMAAAAAAPSRGRGPADPVVPSLPQSASARRPGWRVFNIEVDVEDPHRTMTAATINRTSKLLDCHDERMSGMHVRACYLAEQLRRKWTQVQALQNLQHVAEACDLAAAAGGGMGMGGGGAAHRSEHVAMHEFLLPRTDALRLVTERDDGDSSDEEDDDEESAGVGAEAESAAAVGAAKDGTGDEDAAGVAASAMDVTGGAAVAEGKPGPDVDADADVDDDADRAEDALASRPILARLPTRVSGLHQLTRWVDVGDVRAFDRRLAWTGQAAAELAASKRRRVLPEEDIEGVEAPAAPSTADDSSSSGSGEDDDDSGSDDGNGDGCSGKGGHEDKKAEVKKESKKEVKKYKGMGEDRESAAVTVGSSPARPHSMP